MKIKTSNLTGQSLDWAVNEIELNKLLTAGEHVKEWVLSAHRKSQSRVHYSTDWTTGGPLLEREGFAFEFDPETEQFTAYYPTKQGSLDGVGATHLVAAMRCYVANTLGEEVNLPCSNSTKGESHG